MTLATLIPLVLKASIAMIVLALGLKTRREDVLSLFHDFGRLARSLLAMLVVMPLLAVALAVAFDLHPAVKVALVALALSPVPPLLPNKELKAGGRGSYVVGLLAATGLLAIVTVPLGVRLVGEAIGAPRHLAAEKVAVVVLTSVLGPLVVGIVVGLLAPRFAARAAKPVGLAAAVLLAAACLPLLATTWRPMLSLIGNGTLLAVAGFAMAGLAAGHLLGGPDPRDRVVLALSTAARHPAVAIGAASAIFPGHKEVLPAVVLYLLVSAALSAVYIRLSNGASPDRRASRITLAK